MTTPRNWQVSLRLISLLVFIMTTLLSISGAVIIYNQFFLVKINNEASLENAMTAMYAKEYFDKALDSQLNVIIGLSSFIESNATATSQDLDAYCENLFHPSSLLDEVNILSSEGEVIYTYPYNPALIGVYRNNLIESADLGGDIDYTWLVPQISTFQETIKVPLIYAHAGSYVVGYFTIDVIESVYEEMIIQNIDKGLLILNQNGIIIYDSGTDNDLYRRKLPHFDDFMIHVNDGMTIHRFPINGVDSIISIEESSLVNWHFIVYESYISATQLARNSVLFLLVVILITLVLYTVSLFTFTQITNTHLLNIQNAFNRVKSGNFDVQIKDSQIAEFKQINQEFNNLTSSLQEANTKLTNIAYYDHLSNLFTRNYMKMYFDETVRSSRKPWLSVYLEISNLKLVNDTFGYKQGDAIILHTANILRQTFESAVISRLGSGQYLIFVPFEMEEPIHDAIQMYTHHIQEQFVQPFTEHDVKLFINVNVGFCIYPQHGDTFEKVFGNSAIALEAAIERDGNYFGTYSTQMSEEHKRRVEIEFSLDLALKNDEFYPVFQPIFNVETKKIRGFEALSRWNHQKYGRVMPNEYIFLLEKTNKIVLHDLHIMAEAMKFARKIKDLYQVDYLISINLSAKTIVAPNFVDYVINLSSQYNLQPCYIEFEITEQVLIRDIKLIAAVIDVLSAKGFRFSEDDFGDGYSSFSYLSQFQFDTVKISRNLLSDIEDNEGKKIMIISIIKLAKDLGLTIVVEGVETPSVMEVLERFGVDYVQGYFFSRPKEMKEIDELVQRDIAISS